MIVFENSDVVPIEAFTTMGVNAKPNTDSPLGHFGTGLKYAVAVTLRLGGTFRLWRGIEEYEFYLKDTDFRGKSFQLVRMKRRKGLTSRWTYEQLPFTTEYGKDWQPWMAVRELESNTRDENGFSLILEKTSSREVRFLEEHGHIGEGKTVIVIDCPEMEEAYGNLETIFMPEKELVFESLEVEVYKGPSKFIFYRGLRVTDLPKPSIYTYNFKSLLGLTEDRTSKYPSHDSQQIRSAIMGHTDPDFIASIMDLKGDKTFEEMLDFDQVYYSVSPTFNSLLSERVHTGVGYVSTRMKTYHRNINPVVDVKESLVVNLTISQWRNIIDMMTEYDNDENRMIADEIRTALSDNGTPYDE